MPVPKRSRRSDNAVPHKAKVLGGGHPPWMNDEKICSTEVGLLTDYPWLWAGEGDRDRDTDRGEGEADRKKGRRKSFRSFNQNPIFSYKFGLDWALLPMLFSLKNIV